MDEGGAGGGRWRGLGVGGGGWSVDRGRELKMGGSVGGREGVCSFLCRCAYVYPNGEIFRVVSHLGVHVVWGIMNVCVFICMYLYM